MSRKRRSGKYPASFSLEKIDSESREGSDSELLYGLHAVQAALEQTDTRVTALWLDQGRSGQSLHQIARIADERGLAPFEVKREELNALFPGVRHQGVIARCSAPAALSEPSLMALLDNLKAPPLLLVLDGVQDPHNLGACLRTAEACGVHAVVAPRDRAVGLTAAVRKVASGAAERIPFAQVANLARVMDRLRERGVWMVGMALEGKESLYEIALEESLGVGIVIGAEDRGLRRLTRKHCDYLVRIPMRGEVESLNVSVAAGICLFEARRQRDFVPK